MYCNQHLKIKIRLPLKYLNVEVGDIVEFDKLIQGVKPYNIDYSKLGSASDRVINDQLAYPYFMVISTNKTLEYVEIETYMLHQLDLCPQGFDCRGICGGDAIVDECGTCGGDGVLDECGVCNGPGAVADCGCEDIPEGFCDCEGNIDLGCGCGEGPVSGCDQACGSTLENDDCGFCGGSINLGEAEANLISQNYEIGDFVGKEYEGMRCKCPDEIDGEIAIVDECGFCGGDELGVMSEIIGGEGVGNYETCPVVNGQADPGWYCIQDLEEECTIAEPENDLEIAIDEAFGLSEFRLRGMRFLNEGVTAGSYGYYPMSNITDGLGNVESNPLIITSSFLKDKDVDASMPNAGAYYLTHGTSTGEDKITFSLRDKNCTVEDGCTQDIHEHTVQVTTKMYLESCIRVSDNQSIAAVDALPFNSNNLNDGQTDGSNIPPHILLKSPNFGNADENPDWYTEAIGFDHENIWAYLEAEDTNSYYGGNSGGGRYKYLHREQFAANGMEVNQLKAMHFDEENCAFAEQPCDYAARPLFRIQPWFIDDELKFSFRFEYEWKMHKYVNGALQEVTENAESYIFFHYIPQLLGDVTGDGNINVLDVVNLAQCVLDGSCNNPMGDVNEDGNYSVLDIVELVSTVLSGG